MSVPTPAPGSAVEEWIASGVTAVQHALAAAGVTVVTCSPREVHLDGADASQGNDLRLGFDVTVDGSTEGRCHEVVWAARVDGGPPPNSAAVPTDRGWFGVWRHPHDPALPGLARAVTPGGLGELFGEGPTAAAADQVEVVSLDPLRRSVVRVGRSGAEAYVRVLPPHRVTDIVAIHRSCREAGLPVPAVVGCDPRNGIVITATCPGRPLAAHLRDGGRPPAASTLWDLLQTLGGVALTSPTRHEPATANLGRWAARIAAADPASASRAAAIAAQLAAVELTPVQATIHGDLHHGQLLVDDGGNVCGLVDLDEVGEGDLLDDLGRLIGGATMATISGEWPSAHDPATVWLEGLGSLVDRRQLHHRCATSLFGRATGPWQARRPEAATSLRRALDEVERLVGS